MLAPSLSFPSKRGGLLPFLPIPSEEENGRRWEEQSWEGQKHFSQPSNQRLVPGPVPGVRREPTPITLSGDGGPNPPAYSRLGYKDRRAGQWVGWEKGMLWGTWPYKLLLVKGGLSLCLRQDLNLQCPRATDPDSAVSTIPPRRLTATHPRPCLRQDLNLQCPRATEPHSAVSTIPPRRPHPLPGCGGIRTLEG